MGETTARRRILVASNRGPVSFSRDDDGHLAVRRGGGGVVSGLSSVASQEDMLWVCAALGDADRAAAGGAPGGMLSLDGSPDGSAGAVRMLDIPAATFSLAYNTVANSVLWFVHHMLYDTPNQPQFGASFQRDWAAYRQYNLAFAQALAAAGGQGREPARAIIQDYHLTLAPRMLADLAADSGQRIRIAHFSHTPWAPVDYFRLLPDPSAIEVLDGILGADHAGFLSKRWAGAFLDCCEHVLGAAVDRRLGQVSYRGHITGIGVHPLGVDAPELVSRAAQADVQARKSALAEQVGERKLIVRVDRTELSKNIVRGLAAYRELLEARPQWRGKVMLLALAYPSRHDLAEYREYAASVRRLARAIDAEYGTPDWTPVLLQAEDDYPRSLAGYLLADVLLVNPIRDGMNLVAKEGPILSDRGCVLVLSREAGAADELGEYALMINPFDISATAMALHEALIMPADERMRRCRSLAAAAGAVTPAAWFTSQLAALDGEEPDGEH